MVIGLLGRMNDQSHSTQQPARTGAKDQRPLDSNPRPHRKKGVSIRTGPVSQLLWEAARYPFELTEALCLHFASIWNLPSLPTLPQKNKKILKRRRKIKTKQPHDYRGNGNVPVFIVANIILIKPKLLLTSFFSKYSLQFWSFHRWKERKE